MSSTKQAAREARLDALQEAVTKWSTVRKKQLTDAVALSKAILRGRTGSDRLTSATVSATSDLVVDEIDEFLSD
jgi:hypothetical protein